MVEGKEDPGHLGAESNGNETSRDRGYTTKTTKCEINDNIIYIRTYFIRGKRASTRVGLRGAFEGAKSVMC